MSMIQAGMIGVIGAMLAIQLKGSKAEYGIYVSVAVSIVLFVLISDRLGIFVRTVKELIAYAHLETSYFSVILKMVGITYIAEFASGICKRCRISNDCGTDRNVRKADDIGAWDAGFDSFA